MKTLSVEIRQKSFKRRLLGGIPSNEVRSYLETLSTEFDKLSGENKELSQKLKQTSQELNKMKEIEQSLVNALDHAQRSSQETISQAKKEASLIVKESKMKSSSLIQEAEANARKLLFDAQNEHNEKVIKYKEEMKLLKNDYDVINKHTDVMIEELNRIMRETSHTINRLTELKKVVEFKSQFPEKEIAAPKMFINRNLMDDQPAQPATMSNRMVERTSGHFAPKTDKKPMPAKQVESKSPQTLLEKLQGNKSKQAAEKEQPKNLHEKILFQNFLNQAHSA